MSLLAAVAATLATGCSPNGSESNPATNIPSRATSSAGPSGSAKPRPEVRTPDLDVPDASAVRQSVTTGGRVLEFKKGKKGEALIIAVNCEGKGTVEVVLSPVKVSFPLECIPGKVGSTYNQVALTNAEHGGTVAVQAPTGVRWAMTVGHGAPAASE